MTICTGPILLFSDSKIDIFYPIAIVQYFLVK